MTGKIQNKDSFLSNIAEKLGRTPGATVEKPAWSYRPQDKVLAGHSKDELKEVLRDQCTRIHTDFRETTKEELPETLLKIMEEYGLASVVRWEDPRFEEYGLEDLFNKTLPEKRTEVHTWNPGLGEKNREFATSANIGVTFSDMTLAESGTVVLFSSSDKGRSVSLLPAAYIAVVPKSTIVPRMTQAAREVEKRIAAGERVPSCVNFITGPSNSADIEMNLIVGVHGPIHTAYIVVDDM